MNYGALKRMMRRPDSVKIRGGLVTGPLYLYSVCNHMKYRYFLIFAFCAAAAAFTAGCDIPLGTPEERMFKAAKNDYERNMTKLLNAGMSPDITDSAGWTPLMWAAAKDNLDTLKLLVSRGADINRRNNRGETALHIAARWSRLDTVRYLISIGARPESLDRLGWPPLMWAAMQGRTEVVRALAESGANMEFRDTNGNTALMMAANRGRTATVQLMLELGANRFKTNKAGQTAADVARESKYMELADLIDGGAGKPAPAKPPAKQKKDL